MHLRDHHLSDFEIQTLEAIGDSRTPTASFESVVAISESNDALSIASACEEDTCEHAHLFLDANPPREIAIACLPHVASWLRDAFGS